MPKVLLHKRIIADDNLVLEAERKVELPIDPVVWLQLYNTEWSAPDWDDSDDTVEAIALDLKTRQIHCYMPLVDFRPERSGGDWTEADIRERFQDWAITRILRRRTVRKRSHVASNRAKRRRAK